MSQSNLDLKELEKLTTLKKYKGGVYVLTFHFKKFTPNAVHALHLRLDELENVKGPISLITTTDHKKFYSVGLDFKVFTIPLTEIQGFIWLFNSLLARLLQTSYPTIACINGHCYAGGFMFAMAHDFRLMRQDLGNCCVSEVLIGSYIPQGMAQLMKDKLKPEVVRDMIIFGMKFNGEECAKRNIVHQTLPKEQLFPTAL